ncbi:MAG: hypothetical protein ABIK62_01540 [candidate division WOR-3 bacterium]
MIASRVRCQHAVLCVALITLVSVGTAQATKYAADFEELGASARALGMGSALVALPDPAALYYNPAATGLTPGRSLMFTHAENFGGIVKTDFLSAQLPAQPSVIGLGLYRNGVSGIKLTRLRNETLPPGTDYRLDTTINGRDTAILVTNLPIVYQTVSASDWIAYLNYARPITNALLLGGNAKLIYRSTGVATCFGMGLDAGLLLTLAQDLRVGLQLRNLTTSPLFWDTKTIESMGPKAVLGLSRGMALGQDHRLLVCIQAEGELMEEYISENLGLEYAYRNSLFGRLGFHRGNFTFGLGGAYRRFFLDYGYETAPYTAARDILPATQKLTGGLQF